MTLDVKNQGMKVKNLKQGFEKNLGELSLLESESEKSGLFNTNLLTWEVKTQTIDAAFQRAQLIITKQNEANAYKYVVERLKIWENESTEDDKREKHQYVAKKVKELSNSEASANIAFKLVILRELLSEINALDETFEVVTKTQSDIERDALIFLRDFTKAEGLDTEWLKALEKYEDTGDSSEATKINVGPNLHEQVLDLKTTPCTQIKTDGTFNSNNLYSECKWEENRVRYTLFPSLTSSTVSTGGFKSHRFAMPEEVQNFYSPLEPFKNGWTTKAQSKQVNIPAGGLHRTAPLNRQNRTDADTGVIRNVVENGSAASASLPEGRQVWNNISKPANVEFEAYSPVSGGKVKPSFFPRSIEKFDPGATKQSLPKVEFHLTAATKLLAMLAESDDKCERMHHPRTKLGQPENPQIYEKPANSTTEWPPQIHPLPRVIYRLARTQTADVLKVKESTVQEPSSQKTDDAKSKTFQTTGCGQPVISYIPTSTDMTSLSKDTNGDSHANKGNCPQLPAKVTFDEWQKHRAYKPSIGSLAQEAFGLRQKPTKASPTGFTVLFQSSSNYDCCARGGSSCQPQLSLTSQMVQSRDETAKEWLLRVVRNVGTTVPIAEQQRACRSIFLSGLQDEYRYRLVDLLPIELHELATKLDAAFDARLETRARLNVPGYPRPVARMLK